MEQIVLTAEKRTVIGKQVKQLRRDGWVPAILYGANVKSVPLQVEAGQAEKVVSEVGTSQLIGVRIGKKKPVQALVRDLQRDTIRRHLLHIDLYQVDMEQEITAEVPLVFVGESLPVVERLGILVQGRNTIEIQCLPGDLVDALEVDISDLVEVEQQLTVADLAIPSTIQVLTEPDEMVVRVTYVPEEEIEEEIVEELVEGEPELIARREEDEEAVEGEEELEEESE
jgi:large subunit ribosomal protein L25